MNCHIVPMAYLKSWAIDDTRNKQRDQRETYVLINGEKQPKRMYLNDIDVDTIVQKNLYIYKKGENQYLDLFWQSNHEQIEQNLGTYEQNWQTHIHRIENARKKKTKIIEIGPILHFLTLQLLRTPEYMDKAINDILNTTDSELIEAQKKRLLLDMNDQDSVFQKMNKQFKDNYKKFIFSAQGSRYFITSDFPAYAIKDNAPHRGIYFPLSKDYCLFLMEQGNCNKNNAKICNVDDAVVDLVNYFTAYADKNLMIGCTAEFPEWEIKEYPKSFEKVIGVK